MILERKFIVLSSKQNKLSGEIKLDESYFGARRIRGKRGRGAAGKTPVFGLLKRGGRGICENCQKLF